jgi:CDP-paratose 2-epimerase
MSRAGAPRALITGGAGFIGTNLADRLASDGVPVTLLDSLRRDGVQENLAWLTDRHGDAIRVVIGDVRDAATVEDALVGCDRAFHLAAQVAVTTSLDAPLEDHAVNVQGTLNLLEAARAQPRPPAIVFTSTNKVYGGLGELALERHDRRYEPGDDRLRRHGLSERQPLQFSSPYGCSKGAADQYVLDYAHSYGLPTCVLRMSCIYGPHQRGTEDQGWVAHFLLRALAGEPITVFGDGGQTRDLLYVADLVDALCRASRHEGALTGQAFNMGGGPQNAASVGEVIDAIGRLTGRAPELVWDDWRVADQRWYVSDTGRFSELSGWRPRVSLTEGLTRLYEWFRAERGDLSPALAA